MEISVKNYIEQSVPELRDRIFLGFTEIVGHLSVTYTAMPISGGHLKQSQLEFKVIGPDYDDCKAVEKQLIDLLDMEEDQPYIVTGNIRFHSGVSGGGYLFNDGCQMHEVTLYFIFDWRYINNG